MAVCLEKKPQIREVSPVHLIDEEESVRQFCTPQSDSQSVDPVVNVKVEHEKALNIEVKQENKPVPVKTSADENANSQNAVEFTVNADGVQRLARYNDLVLAKKSWKMGAGFVFSLFLFLLGWIFKLYGTQYADYFTTAGSMVTIETGETISTTAEVLFTVARFLGVLCIAGSVFKTAERLIQMSSESNISELILPIGGIAMLTLKYILSFLGVIGTVSDALANPLYVAAVVLWIVSTFVAACTGFNYLTNSGDEDDN